MCLAIPAQVSAMLDHEHGSAMVDIMGVRRRVSIDLLQDDPPSVGDWVLVHVGFAMSKISAAQADEQLKMLALLGEASAASDEAGGYNPGGCDPGGHEAATEERHFDTEDRHEIR
jgi:hydrogenase expression/formation protein HypC